MLETKAETNEKHVTSIFPSLSSDDTHTHTHNTTMYQGRRLNLL